MSGKNPWSTLTQDSSGNLYGTTVNGGGDGFGTVFEIKAGSSGVTTIASFLQVTAPQNGLGSGVTLDSAGDIFGVVNGGGFGDGYVYEIKASTNDLVRLANFTGLNGATPDGNLTLDSNGDLFGTTFFGGASGASVRYSKSKLGRASLQLLAASSSAITSARQAGIHWEA